MRWIIPIEDSEKDIKEVTVVSNGSDYRAFVAKRPIDKSVKPVHVKLHTRHIEGINELIAKAALEHEMNLASYSPAYDAVQLYRVQEKKKAGRLYPGLGVGVVIYNDHREVLLQLRGGTSNNRKGVWELPGGTVEIHDTLEGTVVKETLEETGLVVRPMGCVDVCEDLPEGQHWVSFGYVAKVVGGKLENKEPYKFDDVAFKHIRQLPENLSEISRKVIGAAEKAQRTGQYINVHTVRE